MRRLRVAFFTHHFLEPTHHAIAQVLGGMRQCAYTVFAKRFGADFDLQNVVARVCYTKGPLRMLSKERFDVAHALYDGKTALRAAAVAFEAGVPLVLSFHGGFDMHAKIRDARYADLTRSVAERAMAVTVPCRGDVARLRDIGVERPIDVLPVSIDQAEVPKRKMVDSSRLVFVGRLIPKKGADLAIEALAWLPTHRLTVIGDGPLRDSLEAAVIRLGLQTRVRFDGLLPLRKTLAAMAESFALLHPARVAEDGNAEGIPQAILWAQAMGLPVITTGTGSIAEAVEGDVSGVLVPPENPAAVAGAVVRLQDEPSLLSQLNTASSLGRHSLASVVAALTEIYGRAHAN